VLALTDCWRAKESFKFGQRVHTVGHEGTFERRSVKVSNLR
jgi:hypothetical protein